MKEYYAAYVHQCLQLCLKDDYNHRENVKRHNRAMEQIAKLEEEMRETDCRDVVFRLLRHEDERVKLNAATFCLKERIYSETAVEILEDIRDKSLDGVLSLSAKMVLQTM